MVRLQVTELENSPGSLSSNNTKIFLISYDCSGFVFSLEEDFVSWREQFWPAVCEHFGVEALGDESRFVNQEYHFTVLPFSNHPHFLLFLVFTQEKK